MRRTTYILLMALGLFSCDKEGSIEPVDPAQSLHFVQLDYPSNFPQIELDPENPISQEGIALGRKLYYDPILSGTGISCSSCHFQENGFSNPLVNSMPHTNIAWNSYYLWKGSIDGNLEDAMMFEVEEFFGTDVTDLQSHATYPSEFKKVFGSETITSKNIAFALAQFIRTFISADSKVDKYLRGEIMLSSSELNGMDIFFTERGDCFHCHSEGLYTDNQFHNTGLDDVFDASNWGRYDVSGNSADIGKFKTPSLRNVDLTGPYMHDGRFATLEQVVEFYNSGVNQTSYADPIMTKPGKEFGLQLNATDKADLVAFLKALTDDTFINNPDLSHP